MMELEIRLTVEEVNAVLAVLGDLPTKTGAWGLLVKIKQQADAQVKVDEVLKAEED